MLKIKDNVDLKELEKFGFKEIPSTRGTIYYYSIAINSGLYVELTVYYDKIITLDVNYEDYFTENLDIIFDLIQAGLVEKVVENEKNN